MTEKIDLSLVEEKVARAVKKLDGPGVVFGAPLRERQHTIIPVSRVVIKGEAVISRPVAVIVVTDRRVKVKNIRRSIWGGFLWGIGMSAAIGAASAFFFPPWRPGESLLGDVRRLILTIRGEE